MVIYGLDLSKTHYSLVVHRDGETDFSIACTGKKVFETALKQEYQSFYLMDNKSFKEAYGGDSEFYTIYLMEAIQTALVGQITRWGGYDPNAYLALEDYAYAATGQITQIAEITGAVKLLLARTGIKVRTHDPQSVKMWATGKGNADKDEMVKAALKHIYIPEFFSKYQSDIADAYFLMDMLKTELAVRKKPSMLDSLPKEQKQVFNRVTTNIPINLLNRPFTTGWRNDNKTTEKAIEQVRGDLKPKRKLRRFAI